MKVTKEYRWKEAVWKDLRIGDSIRLPRFIVPEAIIGGSRELHFDMQTVVDTATIYSIKNRKIHLVFDHCIFQSPVDLNNTAPWKYTQLYAYLSGPFKEAMYGSGIPVLKVSVLSKEWRLRNPFFREGKNIVAFAVDEMSTVCYWLRDTINKTGKKEFYAVGADGITGSYSSDRPDFFVRPCVVIKMAKKHGRRHSQ